MRCTAVCVHRQWVSGHCCSAIGIRTSACCCEYWSFIATNSRACCTLSRTMRILVIRNCVSMVSMILPILTSASGLISANVFSETVCANEGCC